MMLFETSHSIGKNGVTRIAWPDGACLMEQEQFVVDGFRVMRDEALKIMGEQQKSTAERIKHGRQ